MESPIKIWKKNKFRIDLRQYTREFQLKFKTKSKPAVIPGNLYALRYNVDESIITDKHHFTPLILNFGRFRNEIGDKYIRGLNLFYLKTEQKLEILEDFHKLLKYKPDFRVQYIIQIHEKWMSIIPYAFKNYEERRIMIINDIDESEWGMIPLLKDYLFGNFNSIALNEDFQKENKSPTIKVKKKQKTESINQEEIIEEETTEIITNDEGFIDFDDE